MTLAPSMSPMSLFASATATSSPEISMIGTPKCPAIAALIADSDIDTPLMRISASRALEIVCARTPAGFVVPLW